MYVDGLVMRIVVDERRRAQRGSWREWILSAVNKQVPILLRAVATY